MKLKISYKYLAGFVDGEGSIGIYMNHLRTPGLRLRVSNTYSKVIKEIKNNYGGCLSVYTSKSNRHHRTRYTLRWVGVDAIEIIKKMLPYLIVKKDLGKIAIKFPASRKRGFPGRFSPEQKRLRKRIVDEIYKLNRKSRWRW